MTKRPDRAEAVQLRRQGVTYQEIMRRLGLTKSTLWRWLKAEGLVDGQSQHYTERRLLAQKKAAETVHRLRVERTRATMSRAYQDIGLLTSRELQLIGAALYWAEGAKQKPHNIGQRVTFANSDPEMLRVFMTWLRRTCELSIDQLAFELYIHESANVDAAQRFWASTLHVPLERFRIRFKRHNVSPRRKNIGAQYVGLVRISVKQSTDLNRRIAGWIRGIVHALGSGLTVCHRALDPANPGSTPGSPADHGWVMDGARHNGRYHVRRSR